MTAAPVASVGDELLLGGEQHRLLEPALIQIYIGLPIRVIHSSALLGAPMNLLLGSIIAVDDASIEIVERKGVGHPDTICDALAENLSPMLARHARRACRSRPARLAARQPACFGRRA